MANSALYLALSLLIACLLVQQASLHPVPQSTSTPTATPTASEMASPENGTSGDTLGSDCANATNTSLGMNTTDPCLFVCDGDHIVEFNCTAPLNASENTAVQGSLRVGLITLWNYSHGLYSQYLPDFTICLEPATHNTQEDFYTTPAQSHQFVANWVGVFEAYAEHTLDILSEDTAVLTDLEKKQLITLYQFISGLLSDYKELLEPHYCTCSEQSDQDNECFEIPSIPVKNLEDCANKAANIGYHLSRIIPGAVSNYLSWMNINGELSSPPPSSEDWIAQHISCYTPIL